MVANRVGALPDRPHADDRADLQPSGGDWAAALEHCLYPEQLTAARRAFRTASQSPFPIDLRFSMPWQGERYFVTFVVFNGHCPARVPRHRDRLRSLDPFATSFWQAIPAATLATLSVEQCQAIACAFKPHRWQSHTIDARGSVPWRNRLCAFTLVAGPERRSPDRLQAEREKHPLWTGANAAFLLLLQLPFVLTVAFGLGSVIIRSQSRAQFDLSLQAIDIGVRDPIARDAYLNSDVDRLRARLEALGLEGQIRNRASGRLSDAEYEQLILRAFHQRISVDPARR